MEVWYKYEGHAKKTFGKREKIDNNIYTFDIETTSFIKFRNKIYPAIYYDELTEDEQKEVTYYSTMYIWQFGINDKVYYGRTWEELRSFLNVLEAFIPEKKYVFIHNLAFEFQYLKGEFSFKKVMARKSRKIMYGIMNQFNILVKCSYFMSNVKLSKLPKMFKLPVEKLDGDLNYDLLRHSKTPLTEQEMKYCENDCLVVYYYILEELKTYEDVKHIPTTSTGHVRKELESIVMKDWKYRRIVNKAINIDPIVFNRLQLAFAGGITHASWLFADKVLKNIDSYDEVSAYPYTLVTCKFPSSEFREVELRDVRDMNKRFCYILEVEFEDVESRYYNTYISSSKCQDITGAVYDNGRIIKAKSFSMVITDIDFYLILDCYDIGKYIIKRAWFSTLSYLPKKFIEFVLDKYVKKTEYKDNPDYELEYQKEKNKFNALYGMSVTNNIRDNVIFHDDTKLWEEVPLTNEEIIEALEKEKKKSFLSFAYGIFVTAYARDNLFRRVMALDDYVVYMDTDSVKLVDGYDKNVFIEYNKEVEKKIDYVSKVLRIDKERFQPMDIYGKKHLLGLFEYETNNLNKHTYNKFITQGAKKYCYQRDEKEKDGKIIKNKISITVAGVPKGGSKCIKNIEDFNDGLYFPSSITKKQSIVYIDKQEEIELTDYFGITMTIKDKSGCCLIPCSYTLSKSNDYRNLLTDNSSERARYKE